MKGRALVVVLALILATLATVGVFLYARGVQQEAKGSGELTPVIVSRVNIPANTQLNDLISKGDFRVMQIPVTNKVAGAVTSLDQLRDQQNGAQILANEQIPLTRVQGNASGQLGIPEGYLAVDVAMDAPRAVAAVVDQGDHVTIYGTYKGFETKSGKKVPNVTTVLVPSALVLAAYKPNYGPASGGSVGGSEQTQQGTGTVSLTLALTPQDAEDTVFTSENGSVWMGLLAPKATGTELRPITLEQVLK